MCGVRNMQAYSWGKRSMETLSHSIKEHFIYHLPNAFTKTNLKTEGDFATTDSIFWTSRQSGFLHAWKSLRALLGTCHMSCFRM